MDIEQPADPLQTCAYSGVQKPESQMVQIGGYWVAAKHKDACVQFLQQGGVLPVAAEEAGKAPPPRLVPILKESWRLFVPSLPAMLLMHLIIWMPGDLLSSYMDYHVYGEDDVRRSMLFSWKLQLWIGIISEAGCLYALGEVWSGRRPALGEVVGAGFRFWPRMWLVSFLVGLAVILGLVALVIPGIILMVRYTFAACYAVNADLPAIQALGASNRLGKGNFWRIVLVMTVSTIAALVPLVGMETAAAFIPEEWNTWQLDGVVTWIAEIPMLLLWAVVFVLWQSLRERAGKEVSA